MNLSRGESCFWVIYYPLFKSRTDLVDLPSSLAVFLSDALDGKSVSLVNLFPDLHLFAIDLDFDFDYDFRLLVGIVPEDLVYCIVADGSLVT